MKKNNFLRTMLTLGFATAIFACNSGGSTSSTDTTAAKTDTSAMTKDTTAAVPAAQAGPTVPFDVVIVYHTVKNYDTWRKAFDNDSAARKASGLTHPIVERSVDKPNNVKIVLTISDLAKAKAFSNDPRLKEVMNKAGVISKPETKYWQIVRYEPKNVKAGDARVEIVHKVKDFDAWLKGYDSEGTATRSANGMNDIAIGRGVDDSNLVHVVFDVTDMTKAKARLADPALKKLMKQSGVEGTPSIHFYKDASE